MEFKCKVQLGTLGRASPSYFLSSFCVQQFSFCAIFYSNVLKGSERDGQMRMWTWMWTRKICDRNCEKHFLDLKEEGGGGGDIMTNEIS